MQYINKAKKYFAGHVLFNGATHILAGIGIGLLIARPLAGVHPVRWGLAFLGIGIVGHLWAATQK